MKASDNKGDMRKIEYGCEIKREGGYLMKGNDSLVGARICRKSLAHVQECLFGKEREILYRGQNGRCRY